MNPPDLASLQKEGEGGGGATQLHINTQRMGVCVCVEGGGHVAQRKQSSEKEGRETKQLLPLSDAAATAAT